MFLQDKSDRIKIDFDLIPSSRNNITGSAATSCRISKHGATKVVNGGGHGSWGRGNDDRRYTGVDPRQIGRLRKFCSWMQTLEPQL